MDGVGGLEAWSWIFVRHCLTILSLVLLSSYLRLLGRLELIAAVSDLCGRCGDLDHVVTRGSACVRRSWKELRQFWLECLRSWFWSIFRQRLSFLLQKRRRMLFGKRVRYSLFAVVLQLSAEVLTVFSYV